MMDVDAYGAMLAYAFMLRCYFFDTAIYFVHRAWVAEAVFLHTQIGHANMADAKSMAPCVVHKSGHEPDVPRGKPV